MNYSKGMSQVGYFAYLCPFINQATRAVFFNALLAMLNARGKLISSNASEYASNEGQELNLRRLPDVIYVHAESKLGSCAISHFPNGQDRCTAPNRNGLKVRTYSIDWKTNRA